MEIKIKLIILSVFALLLSLSLVSALVIESVDINKVFPGQTSPLTIGIKNNLNDDVEDVSLVLNLDGTLFTTSGSSEDNKDEIREDKKRNFNFVLKVSSTAAPGDYNIPYQLTYTDSDNDKITKTGSFGVTISAETELSYGLELDNNIVDEIGKLSIKIINSGLGDIGFVYVKVISTNGFEILSTNEEYIGNVGSDDFELATFDVLFKEKSASLTVQVTYKDFDNNQETKTIFLPMNVHSREKALELGLIKKDYRWVYAVIAGIILIWFIYKRIKKKNKLKKNN